MNEQNLIQNQQKTEDSPRIARENGRKGGLAKGEAYKKKRTMKAWAVIIGQLSLEALKDSQRAKEIVALMKETGIDDPDFNAGSVTSMYKEAINGNVSAFNSLTNLNGETEQKLSIDVKQSAADYATEYMKVINGGREI